MRDALNRLVHEATLVTLALGIALGWALFQVAEGAAAVVESLLTEYPAGGEYFLTPLTWEVGGRVLTLWPLVSGLIELAIVLAVTALVARRRDTAKPSY